MICQILTTSLQCHVCGVWYSFPAHLNSSRYRKCRVAIVHWQDVVAYLALNNAELEQARLADEEERQADQERLADQGSLDDEIE